MQVVYGQMKKIKSENLFIKFDKDNDKDKHKISQDKEQLKINSNVDVEKQNLEIYNRH